MTLVTPEQSIAQLKAKLAIAAIEVHAMMIPAGDPLEKLARDAQLFADTVLLAFA
jgi:hypothetical protein